MTKADERSDRNGSGSESGYSIGEDFETVIERIKEIRRGPPLDSRAASFDLVLMLARRMIFNEIEREKKESIRKKRQKAALHQFDKKVSLIVQEVSDCKNFEDRRRMACRRMDAARKVRDATSNCSRAVRVKRREEIRFRAISANTSISGR